MGSQKKFDETIVRKFLKQVKKDPEAFFSELNTIELSISRVYELSSSKIGTEKRRILYLNACIALSKFAYLTDWLSEKLSQKSLEKKVYFEKKWIVTAKRLINMLKDNSLAYTTYEDSLGMPTDDSVSSLFLNLVGSKEVDKPYFPTSFCEASAILFKNGEFDYAERFSLIAAIEALWDMYRYEKYDVFEGLMQIPYSLEDEGKKEEAVEYIIKMLNWLYGFYEEWELQESADTFILMLTYELMERWKKIDSKAKEKVAKFWEETSKIVVRLFKGWLVYDDYMISDIIEILVKSNMYKRAFRIVEARIDTLTSYATNNEDLINYYPNQLLKSLKYLAKLGFNLKDRKIKSLNINLQLLRSGYLESKVSELANCMGYSQEDYRIWEFKDETLKKFIKDSQTKTVEIDAHRFRTEHSKGKKRKILFVAECKYRIKPSTLKDVKFFLTKVKDLLNREKDSVRHLPERLNPRVGELWFVSVNGFRRNVLTKKFRIGDSALKLLTLPDLNKILKQNNLRSIPTGENL